MSFISYERKNRLVLAKYQRIDTAKNYDILAGIFNSVPKIIITLPTSSPLPEEIERIIRADINRAVSDENFDRVYNVLRLVYLHQKDYCQGLSYIASFVLCFIDENIAPSVILYILEKYGANVWTHSLVGLHVEIRVLKTILEQEAPSVLEYMTKHGIRFEFFIQKYLYTLFINIFPQDDLIEFFIQFLQDPETYLFKVIIEIMKGLISSGKTEITEVLYYLAEARLPSVEKFSREYDFKSLRIKNQAEIELELALQNLNVEDSDEE